MERIYEVLRSFERAFLGCVSMLLGGLLLGVELFPRSPLCFGGWLLWVAGCLVLARGIRCRAPQRYPARAFWSLALECSGGLFLVQMGYLVARADGQPAWLLLSGLGMMWFWLLTRQQSES